MKKIFTLIAAAIVAVSANAQGFYAVEEGTPEANQVTTNVQNIKLTWGTGWKANKAGQTGKIGDNDCPVTTQGNDNPFFGKIIVDDVEKNAAAGDNGKWEPESGTYWKFEPTYDGTLEICITLNANKSFYVIENNAKKTDYTLSTSDGTEVIPVNDRVENKLTNGLVKFNVKAGKSYYVYCTGSKLAYLGFEYSNVDLNSKPDAGIEDVTVAEDENAPMYNLQGVQVDENYKGIVIKNGKKYLNK